MPINPCRCGKRTKFFKYLELEFYIDECCIEAGYDEQGLKVEDKEVKTLTELNKMRVSELKALAEKWGIKEEAPTKKKLINRLWDTFGYKEDK